MISLSARIAALLVAAIVGVVVLATIAMFATLQPMSEATVLPIARNVAVLAAMANEHPDSALRAGMRIDTKPAAGVEERELSRLFMSKVGNGMAVSIVEKPENGRLVASVQLDSGRWVHMDIPGPPGEVFRGLLLWFAFIGLGSVAIALFVASRITKPLDFLRKSITKVDAQGILPTLPEVGTREVKETARALNQLSLRLRSAMESRMRLVAAAGHDFRTPMTRMRLRAEFIREDAERERWLADIAELDTIADSAIRLVREEVMPEPQQPLNLGDMTREVVAEIGEIGLPVSLGETTDVMVQATPMAIRRALRNLMINAATHGQGATVTLATDGAMARVVIVDAGPGIPEERLSQAFEPFFRVDVARRKTVPGAGLGLAIAKEIVERFGGTIAVENTVPKGLRQTISLPAVD